MFVNSDFSDLLRLFNADRSMRDSSPPNPQAFNEQVWSLVRQVPRGKVVTYGQIGQMFAPPVEVDFQSYKALSLPSRRNVVG